MRLRGGLEFNVLVAVKKNAYESCYSAPYPKPFRTQKNAIKKSTYGDWSSNPPRAKLSGSCMPRGRDLSLFKLKGAMHHAANCEIG